MKSEGMKYTIWFLVLCLFGVLWSTDAYALERRIGSLEFSYDSPADPVGMVLLNHIDIKKPSITYQIPESPGGDFTTPWGILIEGGVVIGDTLIILTNPDAVSTLSVEVTLRDKDGADGEGCVKTITLLPNKTQMRATRVLFSGCPIVMP